jgi:WD40 repeat protein
VLAGHEDGVTSAAFSPDAARAVSASDDETVRIWDVSIAAMSASALVTEVCGRRLHGMTTLDHNEMRLAGYLADTPPIDVCAGLE